MTFVQARHYQPAARTSVRVIVWHDMEAPERSTTAENVAHYFATTSTVASAHVCCDSDSVVECVRGKDVAYHAPGANADGYGVELAGYARQTPQEWRDPFSLATIDQACRWLTAHPLTRSVPRRWLTDAQLADGRTRGHSTHAQVSRVFRRSDHQDPGAGFPAAFVMERLARYADPTPAPVPAPRPLPIPNGPSMLIVQHPSDARQFLCDLNGARHIGADERAVLVKAGVPYVGESDATDPQRLAFLKARGVT